MTVLDGELARRGETIGPIDAVIAATALHLGEPVVTRNRRDFERVPGLRVVSY